MLHIGVDMGGTKIEAVVLKEGFQYAKNPEDSVIERVRIDTESSKGYDHILRNVVFMLNGLKEKFPKEEFTIGFGLPGHITRKSGVVKNSNTVCLNGKPLWSHIAGGVGQKVEFENDANCLALSEAQWGAGKGFDMVFGVIMGTGVGGGLVINGKLHSGVQGIAGEWGHSILIDGGNKCYCGKLGCVETYLCGPAFESVLRSKGVLAESERLDKISKFDFAADVEMKAKVDASIDIFTENFGKAISNIINTIDPDAVVIGGGVSNLEFLYNHGIEKVKKYVFNDELLTKIVPSKLGAASGVYGAALVALQRK